MNGMNRHNIKLRRAAMPRVLKIKRLRELGMTWATIGSALGISRQRAQQIASRGASETSRES